MEWIDLAENRNRQQTLENLVINAENFLTNSRDVGFSRRPLTFNLGTRYR